jgi:hypothetical protein
MRLAQILDTLETPVFWAADPCGVPQNRSAATRWRGRQPRIVAEATRAQAMDIVSGELQLVNGL